MSAKREITRADILPMEEYARARAEYRREIALAKKSRRMEVGPHVTFYFESFDTMWHQIHEMLHTEKGGEEQILSEIEAYNPLIPKGNELVATVMFEIEDAALRERVLGGLGGVEEAMSIEIDGHSAAGIAELDVDRTSAAGKASSVQFIHFPLDRDQIARFKSDHARVVVGIDHPGYAHMAVMPDDVRRALCADFD